MSKGSGRRRITPSDGLRYDPEAEMTNIEERGASHFLSGGKEVAMGLRTGAHPTGNWRGGRWGGRGRKDDHKNWKSHTKGKQYEHNQVAREAQESHRECSPELAARLRQKSIDASESDRTRRRYAKPYRGRSLYTPREYTPFRNTPLSEQRYLIGFAVLEQKVQRLLDRIRWGSIDEYGCSVY